jgi:hypothetical protein
MADVTGTFYAGEAHLGYGTEFLVGQGGGSPETFVALSDVIEVNLGGFTNEIFDKTHLRSPGRAREKKVGLADYENITVRCNYAPNRGGHSLAGGDGFSASRNMIALQKSGTENNFMVILGDESPQEEVEIRGVVSGKSGPTATPDGKMEVTYTITPLRDYRPES